MRKRLLGLLVLCVCGCERPAAPPPAGAEPARPAAPPSGGTSTPAPANPPARDAGPTPRAAAPAAAAKPPILLQAPPWWEEAQAEYARAEQALRRGDSRMALEHLDNVLALDPSHPLAIFDRVRLSRQAGKHDEALAALELALAARPGDVSLIHERALTLYEKGDPAGALDTIAAALRPDAKAPHLRYLRARAMAAMGDNAGALAALEDAVANGHMALASIEAEERFRPLAGDVRFEKLKSELRSLLEAAARTEPPPPEPPPPPLPEAEPQLEPRELVAELVQSLKAATGRPIAFDAVDLNGKPLRLSDHAGKPVVVGCWGSWSAWSHKQIPHLVRLRDAFKEQGLAVVLLAWENDALLEDARGSLQAYFSRQKFDLPCAIITKRLASSLGVHSFPSTLFVAGDGKSYLNATGYVEYRGLEALVTALLKGPSPTGAAEPPKAERYRPER